MEKVGAVAFDLDPLLASAMTTGGNSKCCACVITCIRHVYLDRMESVKSFVRHCSTSSTSLRKRLLEDLGAAVQSGGVEEL